MRLTPEQAIARLQQKSKVKTKGSVKQLKHIGSIGHAEEDIYLFDGADGGVAAPADDSLPPILGVWEAGGEIPPAMKDWLQEYAAEVEWWQNIGENLQADSPAKAKTNASPRQSIAPMISTKWGQTEPYNDTIIYEGKKCVTGCNTTAAAQLIYSWYKKGYKRGCKATKKYFTETNGYEVEGLPPISSFDFDNMADKPKTEKEKKAVQQMMVYLGRAFGSDYCPAATGASPKKVATVLKDDVRMGKNICVIYASKGEAAFEKKIYSEMANQHPVMVAGWKASGGGHSFIIDGYDADTGFYHVNWGWNGSYNGWFALSALQPKASVTYNSNRLAIVGIQPDYPQGDVNGDGEVNIADAMQTMTLVQQGKFSEAADINYDGQVTITDVQLIINKILGK
ncbi:MAG: C10 family peptidase [Prevotella sp.]|nr:C10 family peptidase [Prevotella sp.]